VNNAKLGWSAFALLACLVGFSVLFPNNNRGGPVDSPPSRAAASPRAAKSPAGAEASPSPAVPVVGHESVFYRRDAQGRKTWELIAASVVLKDAQKRLAAQDVRCSFFGDKQERVATLTAQGADMNTANQNVLFRGQVVVTTPKGETLTIKRLLYDGARKKFFGRGGIRFTRATSVLTGDEMVGDPALKTVTVRGHVVADIHSLALPPGPAVPSPSPAASATSMPVPAEPR
jgi:LPS export ABC transporter protein LptC